MKIKDLKQDFITTLSDLYPSEEIQSFFNLLVEKHLGLSRIDISLKPNTNISEVIHQIFINALKRLKQYEPIQYIIGETEFYGIPFLVDKNVLIPRPETEELVSWILEESKDVSAVHNLSIVDIGTGSGCIAISLACNLPNAHIVAIDISEWALQIASQNATKNKVSVKFIEADVLQQDFKKWNSMFKDLKVDIIVSNPPYVREQEKEQIKANVIRHEPATALFVKDEDPLLFYRKIAQLSKTLLKPNGILYFEINEYLYKDLFKMLKYEGFNKISLRKDIFGKDRMVKCKRNE